MAKYKNYENEQLRQKLLQIITPNMYKKFNGIVIDVFLRRAYEFNLSDDQILSNARNFVKNIGNISFSNNKKIKKASWLGATYPPSKSEKGYILLNKELYKKKLRGKTKEKKDEVFLEMYETLTHEIFHGISEHSTGTALHTSEIFRRYK